MFEKFTEGAIKVITNMACLTVNQFF